jgi:hypothetical protein
MGSLGADEGFVGGYRTEAAVQAGCTRMDDPNLVTNFNHICATIMARLPLTFELNCLVLKDDPTHLFTVKIQSNENVSTLKEEICKKKQNAFKGVDADTLVLWKVSYPDDESLEKNLKAFVPDKGDVLRRSAARLHNVFSRPEDEHLHILIQRPCELPL